MNKKFLLAVGGLFGALFAGQHVTTTNQAPVEASAKAESAPQIVTRQFHSSKPAPAKPAAQPTAQRQVVVRPSVPMMHDFVRFVERPGPRKVKYGKRRWVVLS